MKKYFVSAIGTDSGKSVVSAILCKMLQADYWKPIQSGEPSDSKFIRTVLGEKQVVHKESYFLKTPMSPHAAAEIDGVEIKLENIKMPDTEMNLIIEGAGGVMVPLSDELLILDLIKKFDVEVILVSNFYLGSINHTLLTLEVLKSHDIKVKCVVFNGEVVPSSLDIIKKKMDGSEYLLLPQLSSVNDIEVAKTAECWKQGWK